VSRGKVTVVGSFLVGLTLRAERFPAPGETVIAGDFDRGPGGKGSNQAVQAARLGADVEFVGAIGDDDFGEMAVKLFAFEGIGTSYLRRTTELNTGLGFIILDRRGENRILIDPGATGSFSVDDLGAARDRIDSSDVVITQLEIPVETAAAAMEAAHQAGATTILNPAPARELPPAMLSDIDVLTPNQVEARMLAGLDAQDPRDDLDVCGLLLDRGVRCVILTRGAKGATMVRRDGHEHVEPFRVSVVDSTGAGDAFNGALAASLAGGEPLTASARRAAAAGALACTKLGVIPSLPNPADIDKLTANS